jgi:hypothetical protein
VRAHARSVANLAKAFNPRFLGHVSRVSRRHGFCIARETEYAW